MTNIYISRKYAHKDILLVLVFARIFAKKSVKDLV